MTKTQKTLRWESLYEAARVAAGRAYAPYSGFYVGCASLTEDNRVVTGSNVENASYGLTLCAECSMISALIASGGGTLSKVCCLDTHGNIVPPCGRCRQLIAEHGNSDTLIAMPHKARTLRELLPGHFEISHFSPQRASSKRKTSIQQL
ncbi:MAG: cytidine deaminase [Actinomycetaceae bacterium]|nr:cytidine deaminase [Actinomycetaceae bacterium]